MADLYKVMHGTYCVSVETRKHRNHCKMTGLSQQLGSITPRALRLGSKVSPKSSVLEQEERDSIRGFWDPKPTAVRVFWNLRGRTPARQGEFRAALRTGFGQGVQRSAKEPFKKEAKQLPARCNRDEPLL